MDRNLLGYLGSVMGWVGAHVINGISETHVLHHVSSEISRYIAWEDSDALRKRLEPVVGGTREWKVEGTRRRHGWYWTEDSMDVDGEDEDEDK